MTALNAFIADNCIHLFTDTAIYDIARNGIVQGFGSKVIPLPHHGAVMACTGFSWISIVMAGVLATDGFQRFDDLIANLSTMVSKAVLRDGSTLPYGHFELLIAGYSERTSQAELHVLYGYAQNGWPAFRVQKLSKFVSPQIPAGKFDATHAVKNGLALLEAQRATLCGTHDMDGLTLHCVGGAAQYTKVSPAAISIKVLRRWPDEVGKPVSTVIDRI